MIYIIVLLLLIVVVAVGYLFWFDREMTKLESQMDEALKKLDWLTMEDKE